MHQTATQTLIYLMVFGLVGTILPGKWPWIMVLVGSSVVIISRAIRELI